MKNRFSGWLPCRAPFRDCCVCPPETAATTSCFLRDIVTDNAEQLYRGYEILASAPFRITRNSNLYLEEEEARTLLEAVDLQVTQRRKGNAVRLEIESGAHPEI